MMKATAQPMATEQAQERSWPAILSELFKARLTTLVLLTTLVGFFLGTRGRLDWGLMLATLAGTALLASGAAALNQLLEVQFDSLMTRTSSRPLPAGDILPQSALIIGGAASVLGLVVLAGLVDVTAAAIGALTLASYLFLYTPLKRVTTLNTAIGAIPGALPPLLGWVAARGELSVQGWSLFAILFFWQLPHFLAIAWLYREDYARAGFVMLPVVDPTGERTGRQAVCHTLGLLSVSLFPVALGMVGAIYLVGSLVLGALFLGSAISFSRHLNAAKARVLFLVSILYLPLLLALMVINRLP